MVTKATERKVKKVLTFIEAYSYLVDQETKYFELSINTSDKKLKKKYREISDYYEERINNLVTTI